MLFSFLGRSLPAVPKQIQRAIRPIIQDWLCRLFAATRYPPGRERFDHQLCSVLGFPVSQQIRKLYRCAAALLFPLQLAAQPPSNRQSYVRSFLSWFLLPQSRRTPFKPYHRYILPRRRWVPSYFPTLFRHALQQEGLRSILSARLPSRPQMTPYRWFTFFCTSGLLGLYVGYLRIRSLHVRRIIHAGASGGAGVPIVAPDVGDFAPPVASCGKVLHDHALGGVVHSVSKAAV